MNLLVTGGAGFIGNHFIRHMINKYPDYKIVNIDKLTYAGNLENLSDVAHLSQYHFVHGDITNKQLIDKTVNEYDINVIVNFAAESHVDRSIETPDIFVKTNVLGTQTLLDASLNKGIKKFIQISTDEVYGSLGEKGYFIEETPLAPNSPYSASKAAADLMVKSYYETYNMDINITRCSNNYGPYHHPEKLIPLMITHAMENKKMPVYGDGLNVRDWLHVTDHCRAIDLVLHKGGPGEVFNIGGHNERTNLEIVRGIVEHLNKPEELISFVEDRKGHDRRYAIDPSKIRTDLGWEAVYTFDTGLKETIDWYVQHQDWWRKLKSG
ncbi:dTDP-glucose 4,6-dehydratase [Salipaludibacillus sp. CUR1]|uniref:dTDP-glucose 4,6-dehydratase n=1 Tax=Salipaludibacillus sp. CUR1 TaxID=2820003 RepID=UPI001E5505B6|nr:dTDP-glucose 4,6-dehydratase [Salipaludibacillus sp. CUR1]MCE7792764.1 dTDP-glucose 4,6-dehydratase [Salipaludibacillus sp. CUR1]